MVMLTSTLDSLFLKEKHKSTNMLPLSFGFSGFLDSGKCALRDAIFIPRLMAMPNLE